MQGKTHVATGIAASLVILHPTTVTGVIGSVVGGAIGGWISDIDCRRGHMSEGSIAGMISVIWSLPPVCMRSRRMTGRYLP